MVQALDDAPVALLDCTLRDGGYYNAWDFDSELINAYLQAVHEAGVDFVELGFRFIENMGFKGACAYTTDEFIDSLEVPDGLKIAVMLNAADLLKERAWEEVLASLFPSTADLTRIDLVRIACHAHEFPLVLPASQWLVDRGYRVGFNLMQVADRTEEEVVRLSSMAAEWPLSVLYFADSLGSMGPEDVTRLCSWIRTGWSGAIGFHAHDNKGLALQNTLEAFHAGARWLDSTVTGMGRGPGNTKTEELAIEIARIRDSEVSLVPLLTLIRSAFVPMKSKFGWGSNPYYYLSGAYGIHPTYVQRMLEDSRYDEADLIAVIEYLRQANAKSYSADVLDGARNFYLGPVRGTWSPRSIVSGREVLILGSGPGVGKHREALERFVHRNRPLVLALNTQSAVSSELIDLRVACHPVRMLADRSAHLGLAQPLITPYSMLPQELRDGLEGKAILDFGLVVEGDSFSFAETHCVTPSALVMAYALAVASSGGASRILLAGFDGYPPGDPRNDEVAEVLEAFDAARACDLVAITPTIHSVPVVSLYANEV